MDYKKLAEAIELCGSSPKINQCMECPYWNGGDMTKCIPRLTKDAATALISLTSYSEKLKNQRDEVDELVIKYHTKIVPEYRKRAEKAEAERDEAIKQLHGYCPSCKNYTANHNQGACENCKHEYYQYRNKNAKDNWEWIGINE